MDQELFNPQSSSVSSSRIIYTPLTFARTSLLHLQEVGSLQAIHPHVSQREELAGIPGNAIKLIVRKVFDYYAFACKNN